MTTGQKVVGVVVFIVGFLVAIVLDFVLSIPNASFEGTGSRAGIGQVLLSWLVTAGIFWGLYKLHRWAAYGMLGGYAALFLLLSIAAGAVGPYACFNTYGYPPP